MTIALPSSRRDPRGPFQRLLRSEEGFTLIELLVAISMLVAILAGATTLLVGMMQKQPGLSDRSDQVATARVALERMTREIRSGYAVDSATGTVNTVTFRTYMRRTCAGGTSAMAILCRVTYTCTPSTGICTRSTANPDGSSPTVAQQLITGVTNTGVFAVTSAYIGITFRLPTEDGRGALTVSDGARLRNASLGA
jgi:prepilin-type N-terminal cleavage/methylation domain-containing protein